MTAPKTIHPATRPFLPSPRPHPRLTSSCRSQGTHHRHRQNLLGQRRSPESWREVGTAKARVWRLPANRTHELLAMCEEKKVNAVGVDENGKPDGAAPSREPGGY
jgi:hypothetical protein